MAFISSCWFRYILDCILIRFECLIQVCSCERVYGIGLCDIEYYILSLPDTLAAGAAEWSWRWVSSSQQLRNFTNLQARFCSILKMTSYSVEYSCILFRNFRIVEEDLKVRLRAPEKHTVLHSACSGASGSFWKHRCGCSEWLSCWVMTSEPFYILLMLQVSAVLTSSLRTLRMAASVVLPCSLKSSWVLALKFASETAWALA